MKPPNKFYVIPHFFSSKFWFGLVWVFFNVLCVLQLNELVVGDTSGKLLVYKNDDSKPWITRSCVGMVSEIRKNRNSGFDKMCLFIQSCFFCAS